MNQTPRNSLPTERIGGGGAATSGGMRFQQQLGALFSSWILAGDRFDECFGLGAAVPEWIRFETEAPVDDLLIKTDRDGYVAVQAKTTVTMSGEIGSPLGKTIGQFVRHWFVSDQGDGSMGWNRPLDPELDRFVLAVGPQSSLQIREDLPAALRLITQPGGGALNQAQQRAYDVFCRLVEQSWVNITKDPVDPRLLSDLAMLVRVFTFDGDQGYALARGALVKALGRDSNEAVVFSALTDLSGQLMSERGGGDLSVWRKLLAGRGVNIDTPPEFRADIDALKKHSESIAKALASYERIEVRGRASLSIHRDCQSKVEAATRTGALLITGEPGAGKSGVLNALANTLRGSGSDVLQLAVDRYSIESLEGLSRELGLEHPLLEVLDAWDGPEPAYLIVDALDATRGGRGESVFRTLIANVLERKGRWNVVASIRNFDLRMGQQLRALFLGSPPDASFADPAFSKVRHIQVPPWSEAEFHQLLERSKPLEMCLAKAPSRLRELAMVPFNTRLLSELILADSVKSLDEVASQADLLRLYWEHRVEQHGSPAISCLSCVVRLMVAERSLRAPLVAAAEDSAEMIDTLRKDGVLVVVDNERWIQFRHHLLFDYAAARLFLDPDAISKGSYRFSKADALGLMLSPALGFVMRELWESQPDHARFWSALSDIINDEEGDPIIRSTAGRLGAEFPGVADDCLQLGNLASAGDRLSKTLAHVTGALAVRLEDEKEFVLEPWVSLVAQLSVAPQKVSNSLRFLLHILTGRTQDHTLRSMLGKAARALLAYALEQPEPGFLVRAAIEFVIVTYSTDLCASRAVMAKIFDRDRLGKYGHEEVPAVCHKISMIGECDPEFITNYVYRVVFDYEIVDDQKTNLNNSQILNLTSNARQDYEMARWSLGEYLPKFLELHPEEAVRVVINAVEGYVPREHPVSDGAIDVTFQVGGRSVRLREDRSYIWAHDPDSSHQRDAESLVAKLRDHLKAASEPEALKVAEFLMAEASYAILWSRLFLCAVERGDSLIDLLWCIAGNELFLVLPDTRKDAIDVVAAGYARRSDSEKASFEIAALTFDFSSFNYPADARQAFLVRLFSAIGQDNLITYEGGEILKDHHEDDSQEQVAINKRLFSIETGVRMPDPFFWIKGLDAESPENSQLIERIKAAESLMKGGAASGNRVAVSLSELLAALGSIRNDLREDLVHPGLTKYAQAVIGQGCDFIVSNKFLASEVSPSTSEEDALFIELLQIAGTSDSPEIDERTEAEFEQSADWGSPAARVEAAQAYWDLFLQRPDLYPILVDRGEKLLRDRHPAVRLNAGIRLVRIWELDRDRFWSLLREQLESEPNLTVIEHLVGDVLSRLFHIDQQHSMELLLVLLRREDSGSEREKRIFKALAEKLTVLWVYHESADAKLVIDEWVSEAWKYAEAVSAIVFTLRDGIVAGIGESSVKSGRVRQRSQALLSDIVRAVNIRLSEYVAAEFLAEPESEQMRACAQLIDSAGMQLYFATEANRGQGESTPLSAESLALFLQENLKLIKEIGTYAQPHTTYYLLQLVERLVDVNAGSAFDLAVNLLQSSKRFGYQNDSMGVDLLVQLVGVFLADHKDIFEVPARRKALIDCLEIFLEAGWPAARRLLYRLPEYIQ
ncbi:ATP-binding protein [Pseudomonas putida]|uniref:ATP-binding protein n=1 Tax=Pseudomonas putida TaxID=303 RepID=UPI001E3194AA|nr:ATP-binding protein [Pseudomonas putida]MCE0962834.1 ATP-binding protein [Pseudomonas putida]